MKQTFMLSACMMSVAFMALPASAQDTIRISNVGNSITIGARLQEAKWGGVDSTKYRFTTLLQKALHTTYLTASIPAVKDTDMNFAIGGRCLTRTGSYTYWVEQVFKNALVSRPTVVTLMLGTNDSKPRNWTITNASFEADYGAMIDTFFVHTATHPKVLCAFAPANFCKYPDSTNKQNDSVITNFINPTIKKVATAKGMPWIDTHTPLLDKAILFPDSIHPDTSGHKMLADIYYEGFINNNLALTNQAFKIRFLYYGTAPGTSGNLADTLGKPIMYIYPAPDTSHKAPVALVCPGDRYSSLGIDAEGKQVAAWLNRNGITAYVLRYRYGSYTYPIPINDVKRAMRLVRYNALGLKIDTTKIGVVGFSSGGHLASTLGTHADNGNPASLDPVERMKTRPDFMILVYPVITMTGAYADTVSRNALFGASPAAALLDTFSNQKRVTAQTPPGFTAYGSADSSVSVRNAIMFDSALSANSLNHKLVIDPGKPHGFGLAGVWPDSAIAWLRGIGVLPTTGIHGAISPAGASSLAIAIVKNGTISLSVRTHAAHRLSVYSVTGKRLAAFTAAGDRTWLWRSPAPGVYVVRLSSRGSEFSRLVSVGK